MYIIQVNGKDWLVGIWRGWLTLSLSPSRALIYRTLTSANRAIEFYSDVSPDRNFTVQSLDSHQTT